MTNDKYSVENSVLLAACRINPGASFEQLLENLPKAFDWEILVNNAFAHGVSGLLCNSLLLVPQSLVPESMRHASREHLKQLEEKNQQQADQLTFILGELNLVNIKAIPFKGPTLAMSAYGQLNLRTFRDLDFLISEKDIQPCIDKLRALGYTNERNLTPRQWLEFVGYNGEEILFGPGLPLEPHWAFSPRMLAQKVDYEGVWRRAEERIFNLQPILGLSPEDELLVLCIHGCKEGWSKLKWVVDASEFIRSHPALDWELLIDRATAQGLARIVRIGLLISQRLVQVKIPDKINKWIENDRRANRMAMQLANDFFNINKKKPDSWKFSVFHWSMREKLSDRLRYFIRAISQPLVPHFSVIAFPDSLFFLYRPYRLFHDIIAIPAWKMIKKLRKLVRSNETG